MIPRRCIAASARPAVAALPALAAAVTSLAIGRPVPAQDVPPAGPPASTASPVPPAVPPAVPPTGPRAGDRRGAASPATPPRRVIQGAEDVGPLSTAQWRDLRRDVDGGFSFGSVYQEGDLFMRSLGALRAVFPRSEYMSPRVGLSSAPIPAGTRFIIGEPVPEPTWTPRPNMLDGLAPDPRLTAGQMAVEPRSIGPNTAAGATRIDALRGGRVRGTGLADDPVVVRARLGVDPGTPGGPGTPGARSEDAPGPARAAARPSDASLPGRPRTGAASPPASTPMPAIVDDPDYRRERLREILMRAVARTRGSR